MGFLFYIGLAVLLVVIGAGYWFFRSRMRETKEHSHESGPWMGAIRVTGRDGRDMLIVKKDDGSFEMHEEHSFRKLHS